MTTQEIKDHLLQILKEDISLAQSRLSLEEFLASFKSNQDSNLRSSIYEFLLSLLSSRVAAFEKQVADIRESLADIYEYDERWSDAARVLQGINLDSGHRIIPDVYKLKIYIHIASLFLEDEDPASAESFLNRAGLILNDDLALTLRYKSCQAKLCDFKRQFIPASTRYFELSNCQGLALSEQIEALKFAVTCAVLAPAGPPRSRLLALLYKDDRVREASEFSENETGLYPILEKMYKGRLIHKSQVEKFEKTLRQHQLAQHQGKTVLDRAVLEHNMLATTQIYINISFDQLGSLLGVSAIEAEGIASRMILEKRMEGSVDQVDQVLTFKERSRMREWDLIVGGICEGVEEIIGMLDVKVSGGKRCA